MHYNKQKKVDASSCVLKECSDSLAKKIHRLKELRQIYNIFIPHVMNMRQISKRSTKLKLKKENVALTALTKVILNPLKKAPKLNCVISTPSRTYLKHLHNCMVEKAKPMSIITRKCLGANL